MRRILLGTLGVLGLVNVAMAQADTQLGKFEFMRSCASCHGADGKGTGPVAKTLNSNQRI